MCRCEEFMKWALQNKILEMDVKGAALTEIGHYALQAWQARQPEIDELKEEIEYLSDNLEAIDLDTKTLSDENSSLKNEVVRISAVSKRVPAQEVNRTEVERIADIPRISEALAEFAENTTGDNGMEIVRAVMECMQPAQEVKGYEDPDSGQWVSAEEKSPAMSNTWDTRPWFSPFDRTPPAQEVEPVGYVSSAQLRTRNGNMSLVALDTKQGVYDTPVYTHPQSDELRKAAEAVVEYFYSPESDGMGMERRMDNLRTELDKHAPSKS